jgi:hypothetical protein
MTNMKTLLIATPATRLECLIAAVEFINENLQGNPL